MNDMKAIILQALEKNTVLVSLLGKDKDKNVKIYQLIAPYADDFPRITFSELNNTDSDYADNSATSSNIDIHLDVWSKASTTKIVQEVDKTMKELGFIRYLSVDLYEDTERVYHKAMRFKVKVLN